LIENVRKSTISISEAEKIMVDFIKPYIHKGKCVLAGGIQKYIIKHQGRMEITEHQMMSKTALQNSNIIELRSFSILEIKSIHKSKSSSETYYFILE